MIECVKVAVMGGEILDSNMTALLAAAAYINGLK